VLRSGRGFKIRRKRAKKDTHETNDTHEINDIHENDTHKTNDTHENNDTHEKNDIPENTKDNIIQSLQSISETKTENIKEM